VLTFLKHDVLELLMSHSPCTLEFSVDVSCALILGVFGVILNGLNFVFFLDRVSMRFQVPVLCTLGP
jgi:hypothetical protein